MSFPQIILLLVAIFILASLTLPLWVLISVPLYQNMPIREKLVWAVKMSRTWSLDHYIFVMREAKSGLVTWALLFIVLPIISIDY